MPLSKKTIERFNPNTVFLGHIHKPIAWGNVFYLGSPCGLDIGETGKRRFLIYDTSNGNVISTEVITDVLYYDESFVIVPSDTEVTLLRQEIDKRIKSWDIASSDYSKVFVRVKACGYTTDRSSIQRTLHEGFDTFNYYKDEVPCIDELSISSDRQLNAIAERAIRLILEFEWNFGVDEPTRKQVMNEALNVIYCGTNR
jgi:hypothetical protein